MRVSTVLHYVGCDEDRGGIVSVVRALAGAGRFACVLGVNAGCRQRRTPPLPVLELSRLPGEALGWQTFRRSRTVAREVQAWLRGGPGRVFHGHSRAGLAVALRLAALGSGAWWRACIVTAGSGGSTAGRRVGSARGFSGSPPR